MNREKIEAGVRLLLEGIGEDLNREGLCDTPARVARMCEEIYGGLGKEPDEILSTVFSTESNGMVLERDITFHSTCEHHLLPFFGKVHIAYVPNGRVLGISKLARCVEVYARRPQIQERLTMQIADAIMKYLEPEGVMVMIEAEHMCMSMRGIKKPGVSTVTTYCKGVFESDRELKNDFYNMLRR